MLIFINKKLNSELNLQQLTNINNYGLQSPKYLSNFNIDYYKATLNLLNNFNKNNFNLYNNIVQLTKTNDLAKQDR